MQLLKHLLFFFLILILPFCSGVTYSSTNYQGNKMEFQNENNELVSYLNITLIEAGFPDGVFVLQKIIGELSANEKVSLYQLSIKCIALIQNISFIFLTEYI